MDLVALGDVILTQWSLEREVLLDWVDKMERALIAAGRFQGCRTAEIRKWYSRVQRGER